MSKELDKIKPEITKVPQVEIVPEGHHPGNYLLIQPDNQIISVTPRMYERLYKHDQSYKVKKSPNE